MVCDHWLVLSVYGSVLAHPVQLVRLVDDPYAIWIPPTPLSSAQMILSVTDVPEVAVALLLIVMDPLYGG